MTKRTLQIWLLINSVSILSFNHTYGQQLENNSHLESIDNLYHFADTAKFDTESVTMNVYWMDSLIQLRYLTNLEYNLEDARKWRKDSTFTPTEEYKKEYLKLLETAAQNCHSYALEKYFEFHSISDKQLFNNKSVLVNNKHMKHIVSTAFELSKSIDTKRKKNFKTEFTKGSILVFRNKNNWTIHTVFYDGQFQSKNGGHKAKAFDKLKDIYNSYWDTVTIEEYHLDYSKINQYLTTKQPL